MIKAYIIHLKKAEERKRLMQEQISHIKGIKFFFFDAVSYEGAEFEQYRKNWDWDFLTKLYRGKPLSGGEKSCFASHYALWEKCVKDQEEILILEDDIIFASDFEEKISWLVQNKDFCFVRLMAYFQKKSFVIKDEIHQTFENICGTQGYFLTPYAASLFLQKAKIWFCPVDNYLDKTYLHGVKNLFFSPAIIQENKILQSCIDSIGGGG